MTIASFNKILIDPVALEHNFKLIKQVVGENVDVMAMVKSDAYGHGMNFSAQAFARAGCLMFGVAELGEGVLLREGGCTGDILIFLGLAPGYMDYLFSHDLTPIIFSWKDLEQISAAAEQKRKKISLFLKFDCGMSRLGFKIGEAHLLSEWVKKQYYLDLKGFVTHFPSSDDKDSRVTESVFKKFSQACDAAGSEDSYLHSACNSGGTLYFKEAHGGMVRNGIALYGYYPDGRNGRTSAPENGLKPAMTFASRIIQVNDVTAGTGISYGHIYTAERDLKLAVLPVGYSDGYLRNLSNCAEVLIRGRRAPIRGRICMNMCMADITDIEGASVGDEVILLGSQGKETIDADEIGSWCNSISYEILCSLGNNNQRIYAGKI